MIRSIDFDEIFSVGHVFFLPHTFKLVPASDKETRAVEFSFP